MLWCEVEGMPYVPQQAFKYGAKNSYKQRTKLEDFHPWNILESLFRHRTQHTGRLLVQHLHAMQMLAMSGVAPSYTLLRSSRISSKPLINDVSPNEWSVFWIPRRIDC